MVLHIAGYKCANPVCRTFLTLEIHHMEHVSEGGGDGAENLLALCPTCHALHHAGTITKDSIRTWHSLLLTLNEALPRNSVDVLMVLYRIPHLNLSGDGVLSCAGLLAAGLIDLTASDHAPNYCTTITEKGRAFVKSWMVGDEAAAIAMDVSQQGPSIDLKASIGRMTQAIPSYLNRATVLRFWICIENVGRLPAKAVNVAVSTPPNINLVDSTVRLISVPQSRRSDGTEVRMVPFDGIMYPRITTQVVGVDVLVSQETKIEDIPIKVWVHAENYESSEQTVIADLTPHKDQIERLIEQVMRPSR
jgi:hypothetical protein